MDERRTSMIERMVHRIEEHIEEWRRQGAARAAEAEANRDQLWAAAAERERHLAELIGEEEAHRASAEEVMRSEEHTSELQSRQYLVCRLLLEKKTTKNIT